MSGLVYLSDKMDTPDAQHIPVGWVDTHTNYAAKVAVVRQLLRNDVTALGGAAKPTRLMRISALGQNDYVTVHETLYGTILVAKPVTHRMSITSVTIDGVVYGIAYTADNLRTVFATVAGVAKSQIEVCFPRYQIGDYVLMGQNDSTGVSAVDAQSQAWIDSTTRAWAKQYVA